MYPTIDILVTRTKKREEYDLLTQTNADADDAMLFTRDPYPCLARYPRDAFVHPGVGVETSRSTAWL